MKCLKTFESYIEEKDQQKDNSRYVDYFKKLAGKANDEAAEKEDEEEWLNSVDDLSSVNLEIKTLPYVVADEAAPTNPT